MTDSWIQTVSMICIVLTLWLGILNNVGIIQEFEDLGWNIGYYLVLITQIVPFAATAATFAAKVTSALLVAMPSAGILGDPTSSPTLQPEGAGIQPLNLISSWHPPDDRDRDTPRGWIEQGGGRKPDRAPLGMPNINLVARFT